MIVDSWEIIPYVGIGQLKFGISRTMAYSVLTVAPSTFRQGPYAISDTDVYEEPNLHLYYDSEDHLRCIMAFESGPVHYKNITFLGRRLEEVVDALARLGLSYQYDDEGYWFHGAGFVIYAPDNVVKAVTVFRKGYYEEEIDLASKV